MREKGFLGLSGIMVQVGRQLIFLLLFFGCAIPTHAMELVVNPGIAQRTLSHSTIRSIFSMRMTEWPDGSPIIVFVLRDRSPLHVTFSKEILGVFPHQLRKAWNRKIYSGTGQAPTRVKNEQEMHDKIARTPGAIGYLSEEMIDETVRSIDIN